MKSAIAALQMSKHTELSAGWWSLAPHTVLDLRHTQMSSAFIPVWRLTRCALLMSWNSLHFLLLHCESYCLLRLHQRSVQLLGGNFLRGFKQHKGRDQIQDFLWINEVAETKQSPREHFPSSGFSWISQNQNTEQCCLDDCFFLIFSFLFGWNCQIVTLGKLSFNELVEARWAYLVDSFLEDSRETLQGNQTTKKGLHSRIYLVSACRVLLPRELFFLRIFKFSFFFARSTLDERTISHAIHLAGLKHHTRCFVAMSQPLPLRNSYRVILFCT